MALKLRIQCTGGDERRFWPLFSCCNEGKLCRSDGCSICVIYPAGETVGSRNVSAAMHSKYTVWTVWELKTGEVALSGLVIGPLLSMGQEGSAGTSSGNIKVVIVGTGVSDRNLGPPDRQGILVKMLEGRATFLNGAILDFGEE